MTQTLLVIGRHGQVACELNRLASRHGLHAVLRGREDGDFAENGIAADLAELQPALVVNAAAYTAVDQAEQDIAAATVANAQLPARLAKDCAAAKTPFVHISTDYVFDGQKPAPYDETDPRAPLGAYGRSKAAGECAIEATHGDWAIVRTAWVYSSFGNNFVKTMLRLAETRDELGIVSDQSGCPTSAGEVAEACLRIGEGMLSGSMPKQNVWHACGQGELTWYSFARAIFAEAAKRGMQAARVKPIAAVDYPTPAQRPANSRLSCEKLFRFLGWRPAGWQVHLPAIIEELRVARVS